MPPLRLGADINGMGRFLPLQIILAMVFFPEVVSSLRAEWVPMAPLPSQRISPRRSGHTAFTTTTKDVFVFGGYVEEDEEGGDMPFRRSVVNDLWKWQGEAWTQQQESTTGDIPGPRLATATACVGDKAYLIGGWDPQTPGTGGIILDTLHCLDCNTLEWNLVGTLPDGPTSRHVAVAIQDATKILIHNHRCTDHVWIMDPSSQEEDLLFTKQPTTGASPGSLGLHTATMLDDSNLLIFGGAAKDGLMSNRSYLLNTKTWEWKPVNVDSQECPSSRAGACLVTYNPQCAILFGGAETTETGLNPKGDVWALHLDNESGACTGKWEKVLEEKILEVGDNPKDTTKPEPRNAATLTPIPSSDDTNSKQFLMTGGWAPFRRTWDDVFVLRLSD